MPTPNPTPQSYRSTILSCYTGFVSLAIVVTITPLLFIPLRERFGFTFTQLGLLVLINFITQVTVDLGFSGFIDRIGFRRLVLAGTAVNVVGFLLFAALPLLPRAAWVMVAGCEIRVSTPPSDSPSEHTRTRFNRRAALARDPVSKVIIEPNPDICRLASWCWG